MEKKKLEQKQYLMTMIFVLFLFAQAKKTCPKLQKLCLDLILRKADYSPPILLC